MIPKAPQRIALWTAMADHFLDTETRHAIPRTALFCVREGLAPSQVRSVWRFEVSPAVGFNLWSVAGEWAGWDEQWLVARIEHCRTRGRTQHPMLRALRERFGSTLMPGVCRAIECCVNALERIPTDEARATTAGALVFLAEHAVDFCPRPLASLEEAQCARVTQLFPEPFRSIMHPALSRRERTDADRRIRAALRG